jgi:hypothetical protein
MRVHQLAVHRVQLHLARNHAGLGAVQVELDDGGEEPAAVHQVDQLVGLQGNILGRAAVAIDHARHGGLAANLARSAGAGARPRGGLDLADLSHSRKLQLETGRVAVAAAPGIVRAWIWGAL